MLNTNASVISDKEAIKTFVDDTQQVWDPRRFNTRRRPFKIGEIDPNALQQSDLPSCLNMRIKGPDSNEVVIPEPYASCKPLMEMIKKSIQKEQQLNPDWQHYASYITIDNNIVKAGNHHRGDYWHFESMQGSRYPVKLKPCQFFTVTTAFPTEHYMGTADASHLHEDKDNWFKSLAKQAEAAIKEQVDKTGSCKLIHVGKPGEVEAFSGYQIHRSPEILNDTNRTFVRLEFTLKTLETSGDTVNPLLKGPPLAALNDPHNVKRAHGKYTGRAFDPSKCEGGVIIKALPSGKLLEEKAHATSLA